MKTIGRFLKEKRIQGRISYADLEAQTRIKTEFLKAIEAENWSRLPEFPVVLGFVKRVADSLGVEATKAAALLKRDYPPQKVVVNPKPDVADKFFWTPQATFITASLAVILIILAYLILQFVKFSRPPELTLSQPAAQQKLSPGQIQVVGKTSREATIMVNNQPVLVDEAGRFETQIEITPQTKEIVVQAISRSGKEAVLRQPIMVESK